jgi:spore coat polysaccharide biosynthesis predicted glycosyltransferase SpsG
LGARVLGGIPLAGDAGTGMVGRVAADARIAAEARLTSLARRLELPPPIAALPDASIASLVEADVAVVTSGMVAYEAVACGVATIVVGAPRGVSPLAARGAAVSLPAGAGEDRVAAALTALVTSPTRRKALVATSRTLVDGLGADRIADRLIALLAATRTADVGERRVG